MLKRMYARGLVLFALFSTVLKPVVLAQTAVDGAVGGTVVDMSGAIVGGATVVVHENATNAEQTATVDGSGYFRVIHLHPGTYSVTITAPGFEPYKALDLTVQVGLLTTIEPPHAGRIHHADSRSLGRFAAGQYDEPGFCRSCRSADIA